MNKIPDNTILKEFNIEKEKLKEENQKREFFNNIKNLIASNSNIKSKIMDLPNFTGIKKLKEKKLKNN